MSALATHELTWDLTLYFPGVGSSEFTNALERFSSESRSLLADLSQDELAFSVPTFESILTKLNSVIDLGNLLATYVSALTTTDSFAEAPQKAESKVEMVWADVEKATSKFVAKLGQSNIEILLRDSELARDHAFFLGKAKTLAQHQMSAEAEALAADLSLSGRTAWGKYYGNLTSQVVVAVEGIEGTIPMSQVRTLAHSADRGVRENGYKAELAAWSKESMPISAALNSIKGASNTLVSRRGWSSPLEKILFDSNMDLEALEAMMTAASESFPVFRRYMKAKARALGVEKLAFFDLFAPLKTTSEATWTYDRAERFVIEQFHTYSTKLGRFAERAFKQRWVDVEPRVGKRDGAYCAGTRNDESLILMNYKPSFGSVSTLAHELGHAYHNLCLNGSSALQRETPNTLAETASTFCETIIREAALSYGSPDENLPILEASLQGATQIVVDITSRFLFEQEVLTRRLESELSGQELVEIMLDAQRQTYGDGLDARYLHGYMWAAKPHYYGGDFYNFPYMFGLLFGLGLYAVYQKEPEGFHDRYDSLLAHTGRADAAELAAQFGIDIRSPEFWRAGLSKIERDVDRFEELIR